jgi:hypothetical protein
MAKPVRVQLRRTKGWRMPPNTVKVTRGPGMKFGNPYTIAGYRAAGFEAPDVVMAYHVVQAFSDWLAGRREDAPPEQRAVILNNLAELRGKNLACWCAPHRHCHADVLLELANG